MRKISILAVIVFAWMFFPALEAGDSLPGIKNLWAVKPPTVKERHESVSHPDQHREFLEDANPTSRPARTVDGKYCECGRSELNEHKCYRPKQGQYCCNPKTGDCHLVKTTKWNIPFKD